VLVVDDTPGRASSLSAALAAVEGVQVACTLETPLELLRRVEDHRPDVVLIATDSPSRDVLEQLAVVNAAAPRPMVMFTEDAGDESIRAAIGAGVSAYIVDGLSPGRLGPILRVAIERFGAEQRLRAELEDTKIRLADRKVIDRAKGILMKLKGLTEDEAYVLLRSTAMREKKKIGEIAQSILTASELLK
jgi:response regulator NasT